MDIKSYKSIDVSLLQATPNPQSMLAYALDITQKRELLWGRHLSKKTVQAVASMNHGSVFEHIVYTFMIKGASRSFLAQCTRHRMASYTSGSQHYQDYSEYGASVHPDFEDDIDMHLGLSQAMDAYKRMVKKGIPPQEARQVLPNAMQNNLMLTINARSLMNFLNLRLCNRNTAEIMEVANKMRDLVIDHFPELWMHIGPDCVQDKCRQGKMTCNPFFKHK